MIALIERDAPALVEALGVRETLRDLKERIEPGSRRSALDRLMAGILKTAGASSPLRVTARAFNEAAEQYYRGPLLRQFIGEALDVFARDLKDLAGRAARGDAEEATALSAILSGENPEAFLAAVRQRLLDGFLATSVLLKLIHLELLVIRHRMKHNHDPS